MAMIAAGLALPGHIILFGDIINEFVFHELAETFMNDVDHFLMSEIISVLLGNGSVVYDECIIDCQELPHGVIDIVGGRIRQLMFQLVGSLNLWGDLFFMIPLVYRQKYARHCIQQV